MEKIVETGLIYKPAVMETLRAMKVGDQLEVPREFAKSDVVRMTINRITDRKYSYSEKGRKNSCLVICEA